MQSAKEEIRDLERVRYVTENYEQLQGLRNVPLGFVVLALGVFMLSSASLPPFSPVASDVFFYGSFALLAVAFLLYFVIGNYYERRFGWVHTSSIKRKQVVSAITGITVLILIGIVNLVFQPPIHMIWLFWGLALTVIYWRERRFRMHYIAIGLLVSALSFMPLLDISRTEPIHDAGGLILFLGILFVVGGFLDHLLLVRTMKTLPEADDGRAI